MKQPPIFIRLLISPFILIVMYALVYYSTFLPIWIYRYFLLEWNWFLFFISWLILSGTFASLTVFSSSINAIGGIFFLFGKLFYFTTSIICAWIGYLAFIEIWVSENSSEVGVFPKILICIPVLYGIGFLFIMSLRRLIFGISDIEEG
jgi:hypothetical protein